MCLVQAVRQKHVLSAGGQAETCGDPGAADFKHGSCQPAARLERMLRSALSRPYLGCWHFEWRSTVIARCAPQSPVHLGSMAPVQLLQ